MLNVLPNVEKFQSPNESYYVHNCNDEINIHISSSMILDMSGMIAFNGNNALMILALHEQ